MSKLVFGERIGRQGEVRCGVAALITDEADRVLLTRRSDNGRWCLPGGHVDAGENVAEACVREVLEETGLDVLPLKLIGVYSTPDALVIYPDGNKAQFVSLCFEVRVLGGELALSEETTEFGYYTMDQIRSMDVLETHLPRIEDGLTRKEKAYVR